MKIALRLAAREATCVRLFSSGVTVVFELTRKLLKQGRSYEARELMEMCQLHPRLEVVNLDISIATRAAHYPCGLNLSTADSIILATAVEAGCPYLVSGNAHFDIAEEQGIIKVRTPASLLKEWEESDSGNVS